MATRLDGNPTSSKTDSPDSAAAEVRGSATPREAIRLDQQFRSIAISVVFHAVVLLLAAMIVIPLSTARRPAIITALETDPVNDRLEASEVEIAAPVDKSSAQLTPLVTSQLPEVAVSDIRMTGPVASGPPSALVITEMERADVSQNVSDAASSNSEVRSSGPAKPTVRQTASLGDAVDPIIRSIKTKLAENNTLVVWLIDRSISMQQQRVALAERLKEFVESVTERQDTGSYKLTHAVVAFGARPEKVILTTKANAAIEAIRKPYTIDRSGKENIFAAIDWCELQYVKKTRSFQDNSFLFVVCTDESGDDYLRLERTIDNCRESKIEVSVIGPSAVLGQMQGYHAYQASDNRIYYLPVARGPETAFPQRLRLNYWFRGVPPEWDESRQGPWNGELPVWQGGSNFDAMLSGFSPYALTRLTMVTGGSYVIFDRPADRSPYSVDQLSAYMPDYRAAGVISKEIQGNTLRMAVVKAVQATHGLTLREPRVEFGMPSGSSFYVLPTDFQSTILQELELEYRLAVDAARSIDSLLLLFEERVVDRLYNQETSARWRAWYDLTYGRLLATRVRYGVYSEFLSQLTKDSLGPDTNGLSIRPVRISREVETGPQLTEAIRLLERCIDSNPESPWQFLAERELADGFGLRAQEHAVPLPTNFGVAPVQEQQVSLPRL